MKYLLESESPRGYVVVLSQEEWDALTGREPPPQEMGTEIEIKNPMGQLRFTIHTLERLARKAEQAASEDLQTIPNSAGR